MKKITQNHTVFLVLIVLLLSISCKNSTTQLPEPLKIYTPKYATGFKIYYYEDFKILEVGDQYRYCLQSVGSAAHKDTKAQRGFSNPVKKNISIIATPVNRMACMAHSHWAAADLFDKTETIFGICDPEFLNDSNITKRIENNTLQTIATNQTIYMEALMALQPQMLMVSFFDSPIYQKVENQNIVVVRNGDYLENHPLGRAEWMIFVAAFFDEEERAIARFEDICRTYNDLKEKVSATASHPTVFDGLEYNGIWYVSGGKSFMAQFYADAGADYLWKDNDSPSSVPMDFETVYQQGINADFWRLYLHNNETYSVLAEHNRHYADFKSWKERNIIYCNNLKCNLFGDGVFQPEVILNDFVRAFHPEIATEEAAVYYKKLDE